ncbi:hypothetical protein CF327_g5695 [Tilletia walkeri]|nr:hypothetical protein CF327_g5695 [Tilletia walkeri]
MIVAHSTTTSAEMSRFSTPTLAAILGSSSVIRDHAAFKEGKYDAMVSALRDAYPTRKHRFKYTTSDLDKVAPR